MPQEKDSYGRPTRKNCNPQDKGVLNSQEVQKPHEDVTNLEFRNAMIMLT